MNRDAPKRFRFWSGEKSHHKREFQIFFGGSFDHLLHRLRFENGQTGGLLELILNRGSDFLRFAFCSDDSCVWCEPVHPGAGCIGKLRLRHVNSGLGKTLQTALPYIADDTDDLPWLFAFENINVSFARDQKAIVQRIASLPKCPCHCFIDERYSRSVRVIAFAKRAASPFPIQS